MNNQIKAPRFLTLNQIYFKNGKECTKKVLAVITPQGKLKIVTLKKRGVYYIN